MPSADPSLVSLEIIATGAQVRIGERALRLGLLAMAGENVRPTRRRAQGSSVYSTSRQTGDYDLAVEQKISTEPVALAEAKAHLRTSLVRA